jgi:hypothetical protein
MGPQPAPLTPADIQRFDRDGYLVVRQAFSPADARAMEARWWSELEDTHGVRRDDRSSWRPIRGDLKAAKRDPVHAKILTERVRGVFDGLLGAAAWSPPRDWGRTIATFPEPGAWEVPTRLWHWDSPCELHLDRPRALFVVSFIGPVAPRSGGTLILSGSPRLLIQQERRIPADQRRESAAFPWDRFHRCHPWLMALTGQAPSPADRIAAFMDAETIVDGVPLRVVELTGEPGDMVFCHPAIVHCAAPNRGAWPRFMRIKQQFLTHEGRSRLRESRRPLAAEDHRGEVKVKVAVVSEHHLGGGVRVAGLQRREELLVQQSVGVRLDRGDLARQDDVPFRPGRNGVPVLDQHLIVRAAVDHAVKRPVDVRHGAGGHGDAGGAQVPERFSLVLGGDQRSRPGELLV